MTSRFTRRHLLLQPAAAATCLTLPAAPLPADAEAAPITPGEPYHAIGHTSSGQRGATYEVYESWDHVRLSDDDGGTGDALVFERDGDAYRIRSTGFNWGGYDTWCAGNASIFLGDSNCATRWSFAAAPGGGWYLKEHGTGNYVTNPLDGKQWLKPFDGVVTGSREFTRFIFTPAG
ncbi:hypothetical protein ACWEPC_26205 [Nonomuraea sp. NPDC004297]